MHLLITSRQGFQIVTPHPIQLQLERASRLQMPVNPILLKPIPGAIRKELRKLLPFQGGERDPPDTARQQLLLVPGAERAENPTHRRIVRVAFILNPYMQDVYRLLQLIILDRRSRPLHR